MARTNYPNGLRKRGRSFWRELTAGLECTPAEMETLLEACRALDLIDELTEAVETDGTMISGSTGQRILHPAIAEIRQQQAAFVRLVSALHLPEEVAAKDQFRRARAKAGADAKHGIQQQRRLRPVG